jgi:hypothetical protein
MPQALYRPRDLRISPPVAQAAGPVSRHPIDRYRSINALAWVHWFNHRRLLEPIGNIPPAEAEQRYYAMLEQPEIAA